MEKYLRKINSEFEDILMSLSSDPKTDFKIAYDSAVKYSQAFAEKKSLSKEEYQEILQMCCDIIQDWFPDISGTV